MARRIRDEDIRRILEDSDGEEEIIELLDQEEDLQDEEYQDDDDEDGEAYLEVGPVIEETVENIAREVQIGDVSGQPSNERVLDNPIRLPTPDVPSRAPVSRRRRRSTAPVDIAAEWSFEVKELSRKQFTGHEEPPRQQVLFDSDSDIYTIFRKIIDDDVINLMVQQTNLYAQRLLQEPGKPHSRKFRWSDVDEPEMLKFLGVIFLTGIIVFPTLECYWKKDDIYYHPLLHKINMSYNRFRLILRCWHFCDNNAPREENDRLYKISPLIDLIIGNSRTIYTPGQIIVVDESMVHFRGRLLFRQYIPSKTHKYGIKIYKLCSAEGYTWGYQIYSGQSVQVFGLDTSGSIVVTLAEGLLDEGRCMITDNYYTSVPLAEFLLSRNTDLCGTVNRKRRGLPKDVMDAKLATGEIAVKQKNENVTVLKWKDKRDVCALSTCHGKEMSPTSGRTPKLKPNMILSYNKGKKGIDVADQMASYNSPIRKTITWYKKVAIDLLSIAVVNSTIIYNEMHPGSREKLTILAAHEAIVKMLLQPDLLHQETRSRTPQSQAGSSRSSELPGPSRLVRPSSGRLSSASNTSHRSVHFLESLGKKGSRTIRRRCVGCYKKLLDEGGLAPYARAKAKRVSTQCKICKKAYCFDCFSEAQVHQ